MRKPPALTAWAMRLASASQPQQMPRQMAARLRWLQLLARLSQELAQLRTTQSLTRQIAVCSRPVLCLRLRR